MKAKILSLSGCANNASDCDFQRILRKKKKHAISISERSTPTPYSNLSRSGSKSHESMAMSSYNANKLESAYTQHFVTNNCPGVGRCENYKQLKLLELKMKKLLETNQQLLKVNEYLAFKLSQKDEMYRTILNENTNVKKEYTTISTHMRSRSGIFICDKRQEPRSNSTIGQDTISQEKKENVSLNSFRKKTEFNINMQETAANSNLNHRRKNIHHTFAFTSTFKQLPNPLCKGTAQVGPSGPHTPNGHLHKSPLRFENDTPPKIKPKTRISTSSARFNFLKDITPNKVTQHYEKLNEITLRNQKRKYKNEGRISFLSLTDELLQKMASNLLLKEVYKLTLSDEDFLDTMRTASEDKLISYCDLIGNMIQEYQETIKLIQRVKAFLKASTNLVNSVLLEDSTQALLKNTCDILCCDRASLFVLDKISDMLVVYSGEGLKKIDVKVPKNAGIVGSVFTAGQKIRIEDAYSDERFNKEVDKLTNFKTKTILAMPLKDSNGDIFGVIQAINKKSGVFDNDDEELMEIFSQQASAILKNSMNLDESGLQISRLKLLITYSLEINHITTGYQFILRTEELLMSVFSSRNAQVLINCNGELVHVTKYQKEKIKKCGIVNMVLQTKDFHGCSSIKDCRFYNSIADLDACFSMITFPIIHDGNVLAVCQTVYNNYISDKTEEPRGNEMVVVQYMSMIIKDWIRRNEGSIFI